VSKRIASYRSSPLTHYAGIGPIPSIYFSEAFPLSHREIGAAFTICVNNAVGSALSLTFPALLAKITPTGAFGFYAALNLIAFAVIFFIVRSMGVTLSMSQTCADPSSLGTGDPEAYSRRARLRVQCADIEACILPGQDVATMVYKTLRLVEARTTHAAVPGRSKWPLSSSMAVVKHRCILKRADRRSG
jgi:hypothetical protein